LPTGNDSGRTISFVLKYESQSFSAIRFSVKHVHVIKPSLIERNIEFVKETFFSFARLDAMISQVLYIAILLVGIIPFKSIPVGVDHRFFKARISSWAEIRERLRRCQIVRIVTLQL
jgi:hypothetical protein